MRKIGLISLLTVSPIYADTLTLVQRWRFGSYGSDVWGYKASDGTQYAIYGVSWGIAIVNVNTLSLADTVRAATCLWRDFKTYRNYLYAVSECTGPREGIMIIDLSTLPDSVRYVKSYIYGGDTTSHNIYIDTVSGFLYAVKQDMSGVRVIDINDPENPVEYPYIPTGEAHDIYVRNDTVFVSEGYMGSFSVWDLTDKSNPTFITRKYIPASGYSHNIWVNESGTIAVTTEEEAYKTIKVWDISDLSNITLLGEYLGGNFLAHNALIMGDKVFISHYTYGVAVVDISDPTNPTEVAHYDTYTASDDPDYSGCWGVYPYTDGGYVYAGNMNGYLYILRYDTTLTYVSEIKIDSKDLRIFVKDDELYAHLDGQGYIRIYDLGGRMVFRSEVKGALRWKPNRKGVYFYELRHSKGYERGKILIR